MNSQKTWVVIAESSRARIFSLEKLYSPLEEIEDFTNINSRLRERELTSDKPGHVFDGKGHSSHRLGHINGMKEQECQLFAKTIGERLEKARSAGEFDKLVLIASPDFLGLLRKELSTQTKQMVILSIPKNFVRHDPNQLREILTAQLPGKHNQMGQH